MPSSSSERSGVSYDPGLIAELHDEHRTLLQQLKLINQLVEEKQFAKVAQMLERFQSTLIAHIYQENLKLYIYLQSSLKGKPQEYAQMRVLRKEMESIRIEAMDFLDKYKNIEQSPQLQASLMADLTVTRALFNKRIQTEEKVLFPAYIPMN